MRKPFSPFRSDFGPSEPFSEISPIAEPIVFVFDQIQKQTELYKLPGIEFTGSNDILE